MSVPEMFNANYDLVSCVDDLSSKLFNIDSKTEMCHIRKLDHYNKNSVLRIHNFIKDKCGLAFISNLEKKRKNFTHFITRNMPKSDNFCTFIAEAKSSHGHIILGCISLQPIFIDNNCESIEITCLGTNEKYRKKGIAAWLIKFCVDFISKLFDKIVPKYVLVQACGYIKVYEKLHFKKYCEYNIVNDGELHFTWNNCTIMRSPINEILEISKPLESRSGTESESESGSESESESESGSGTDSDHEINCQFTDSKIDELLESVPEPMSPIVGKKRNFEEICDAEFECYPVVKYVDDLIKSAESNLIKLNEVKKVGEMLEHNFSMELLEGDTLKKGISDAEKVFLKFKESQMEKIIIHRSKLAKCSSDIRSHNKNMDNFK